MKYPANYFALTKNDVIVYESTDERSSDENELEADDYLKEPYCNLCNEVLETSQK